ncbi:MAG: isochorismatase family cysteine hydrolase [Cytophagales bacterium]|nr:cysteine hydrolase [Bernardetiaceae bacterium]MDW8203605.1 isochorismatase family cysteine hydrolase [Cytophagales bacterium]
MTPQDLHPKQTALLLVDMQNDFFFKKGAYPRNGLHVPDSAGLIRRLATVAHSLRRANGLIISAQFTLLPGKDGEPLIPEGLKKARPFITKGDFCPGDFGHRLVEELAPADFTVDKISFSAFYQTFLDFILRKQHIRTLLIGGIVTNSGVAATLRDGLSHGYEVVLLTDGCAAFSEEAHQDTLQSLRHVAPLISCDAMADLLDTYK